MYLFSDKVSEVESFPLSIVEGLVAIKMKSTNCLSVHQNDKILPRRYNCYISPERFNHLKTCRMTAKYGAA